MNLLEQAQAATEKRNTEVAKIVFDHMEFLSDALGGKIIREARRGYRSMTYKLADLRWGFPDMDENPFEEIQVEDTRTRRSILKMLTKCYRAQGFSTESNAELDATFITIKW